MSFVMRYVNFGVVSVHFEDHLESHSCHIFYICDIQELHL